MSDGKTDHSEPASQQETRALDADELEMANLARHPALGELSDGDLSDLVGRLRTRRDRARDIANRQGREARAKADPSGAAPASGNEGTLSKHDYLKAALDRAMAERDARAASSVEPDVAVAPTQRELADKAMAMKSAGQRPPNEMMEDGGALHPNDPDASEGKKGLEATE